jgi:hypothetical protein
MPNLHAVGTHYGPTSYRAMHELHRLNALYSSLFCLVAGVTTCFSIVEQGEQAYGKHVKKDNEEPVPEGLLKKFLRVQNGADVRGVVLDGTNLSATLVSAVGQLCASEVSSSSPWRLDRAHECTSVHH